jgi:hypothetical protein
MTTSVSPDLYAGRVLLSRDGGASLSTAFEAQDVRDVTYAREGAEVWIADYDGVAVSTDGFVRFERRGGAQWTSCVIEHDDRLWICGQLDGVARASGVGVSIDGARTLSKWLDFHQIVEPIACPDDGDTRTTCEAAWAHWQVEVLGLDDPTAVDDAGPDARSGVGGSSSAGTGGSLVTSGGSDALGAPPDDGAGVPPSRTEAHDEGWCTIAVEHRPDWWRSFVALVVAYFFRRAARAKRE